VGCSVLVVVASFGVVTSCGSSKATAPAGTIAATTTVAPPPPDPSSLHLELGNTTLHAGDSVSVTPVNSGSEDAVLGVVTEIFRWSGTEWVKTRWTMLCPDRDLCSGDLDAIVAGSTTVPSLGIAVPADGRGQPERLRANGLKPGQYQLVQKGMTEDAVGRFEIVG
jgi:hypothetical protein